MKVSEKKPPREFEVGGDPPVKLRDCAVIELASDEMVTFRTKAGRDYDVVAKAWGFYATPSLNGRLKDEGFKSALVRNSQGKYYVMLVDPDMREDFKDYLNRTGQIVKEWLDERPVKAVDGG